jgi:hypothetical protein
MTKADAILRAIRNSKVGDQVIIHNNAGMVWCIIKIVCQEHPEKSNRGKWRNRKNDPR